jgi:hypothetical protein
VVSDHYILGGADGRTPVPADLMTWAKEFEAVDARRVARTQVCPHVSVSTVFLGLDHRFGEPGPPLVFETMSFGGSLDQQEERYCTWAEAEAGHARWVERATLAEAAAMCGAVLR